VPAPAPIPAPPVAQSPAPPSCGTQCSDFAELTAEAQKRRTLVSAAMKAKADRNELCTLMTNFVAAETNVVKFLEDNKVWCGVPEDALKVSKANHEKSMKLRTMACSEEGPRPKAPSLSDAIKAPSVTNPVIRCYQGACPIIWNGRRPGEKAERLINKKTAAHRRRAHVALATSCYCAIEMPPL
jgi:hypothetical protein